MQWFQSLQFRQMKNSICKFSTVQTISNNCPSSIQKPANDKRVLQQRSRALHKCFAVNLNLDLSMPEQSKRLVSKGVAESFSSGAVVVEKQTGVPQGNQVLVKVLYVGINGGCETFRIRGEHWFQKNKEEQFLLGAEGAGVVVAVGQDVKSLAVGDHIAVNSTGFQEFAIVQEAMCTKVPEANKEAVTISLSGTFAANAILGVGQVSAGMTVLVTAGGGAAGHLAAQFAKLRGAHVIVTCGTKEKQDALNRIGFDRVIMYRDEDIKTVVEQEYGQTIDVVFDGVGGQTMQTLLPFTKPGGTYLLAGYISQYPHTQPISQSSAKVSEQTGDQASASGGDCSIDGLPSCAELFWDGQTVEWKGVRVIGNPWPKDRSVLLQNKAFAFECWKNGELEVLIDSREFEGLESIPGAVDYMLSGSALGKVVVQTGSVGSVAM